MNRLAKHPFLPVLALGLGGVGLALRFWLYRVAAGAYGLLTPRHPLTYAVLALTFCTVAGILWAAWQHRGAEPDAPAPSPLLAAGYFLAAVGICSVVLFSQPLTSGYPGWLWRISGAVALLLLGITGIGCLGHKQPSFLCHLAVCLFYLFHIIDHYRTWSSNPQIMDQLFALLSAMAMALFSFYCAARDVGLGRRPVRVAAGLAAIFFSTVELSSCHSQLFYLGGVLWVLILLCSPAAPCSKEASPDAPA